MSSEPESERLEICAGEGAFMKILFIVSTDDAETVYNAIRLANVGVRKATRSVFSCLAKVCFLNDAVMSSST